MSELCVKTYFPLLIFVFLCPTIYGIPYVYMWRHINAFSGGSNTLFYGLYIIIKMESCQSRVINKISDVTLRRLIFQHAMTGGRRDINLLSAVLAYITRARQLSSDLVILTALCWLLLWLSTAL